MIIQDRITRQKRIFACIIALLGVLCLIFFREKESGIVQDEEEETYQFVDVMGIRHEARILDDVPKCDYDYERLVEENGYKYYTDAKGRIISTIGIDVSEYQPSVDWQQVKNAGIDFAIIRVGYRGYGEEGRLVEDAMFKSHIEGALEAGLEVGVYFFSQALNKAETIEEAEFVMDRIRNYEITYPVVFDTEEIKEETARTSDLDKEQYTQNCITFCDAVKDAGYTSMIYANMKWMAYTLDLEKLTNYAKWYADYEPKPQCPYEFQMWQYTEKGQVPGVDGNVDLDVCFTLD